MNSSKFSLEGKNAVVTGSSMGIGRVTALRLAEEGANVVVNSLEHEEMGKEVVEHILGLGRKSFEVKADVRVFEDVKRLFKAVIDEFGFIDILVNNAGIVADRTLLKMSIKEWTDVIQTNLNGVFYCSKFGAEEMVKRGAGRIINISSVVAHWGAFGQTNYAASKAGVLGFTRSLAREMADKGITVNAVCPGYIDTSMTRKMPEAVRQDILNQIPLKRFGKPTEVADVIAFLASDKSSYITGQVFNVNGGLYM